MGKIRRNQLCPCGSGKKYKNCCLCKGPNFALQKNDSKVEEYIASHEKSDILNLIVALQLNPQNHGANVRIERLANLTTKHFDSTSKLPNNLTEFQRLLDIEYDSDYNEDPPVNFHTEPFAYYGGNYQVFGGISTHSVEIFTRLTNIVAHYTDWPEGFKEKAEKGCLCLLNIVQLLTGRAKLSGYVRGTNRHEKLNYSNIQNYTLVQNEIAQILFCWRIPGAIYRSFVWNDHCRPISNDNLDSSDLLRYPIVEHNGKIYVLMLSNEADCLNKYVLETAKEYGCEALLNKRVHQSQMGEVQLACSHMGWREISEVQISTDGMAYEQTYQMDVNWYAHVYYVHDMSGDWRKSFVHRDISNLLMEGNNQFRDAIKRNDAYDVLTLVLYANMGENMTVVYKPLDNNLIQLFQIYDFVQLCPSERWNKLSLLHFAQAQQGENFLLSDPLDLYTTYKAHSDSFYLSDNEKPNIILTEVNSGYAKVLESKSDRYKHAAIMERGAEMGHVPVERVMEEGPIFGVNPLGGFFAQCVECFDFPFWVICEQKNVTYDYFQKFANMFTFWLYRVSPRIKDAINAKYRKPIVLKMNFLAESLEIGATLPEANKEYDIIRDRNELEIDINAQMIRTISTTTNDGEREVMVRLLQALLSDWSSEQVQDVVDTFIPKGMAKMMLVMDTSVNVMGDPRWLPDQLLIPEYQTSRMLDKLQDIMKECRYVGTETLENSIEKQDFLRAAVSGYLSNLRIYCNQFENKELLTRLMNNYERLVYERDHNKLIQPAQMLCFGLSDEKKKEMEIAEQNLTSSELALRCLIEFVVAQPTHGTMHCGDYEIGIMMAYMHEIDVMGSICNSIDMGISNHIIKKLPSGRYGIYDDDFMENFQAFHRSYMDEMGISQIHQFPSKLRLSGNLKDGEQNVDSQHKFDVAFITDWGFSLTHAVMFTNVCSILCYEEHASVVGYEKSVFVSKVQEKMPDIETDELERLIQKFSLEERESFLPNKNLHDYAPWEYNREYSYARRFLVRVGDEYFFGLRNATGTAFQLLHLLTEGRLPNCGPALSKLRGEICKEKGKAFTSQVRTFLQNNTQWNVLDYEVKITNKAPLNADANYGDIDVLAYDRENAILYSLECKDTVSARNIHETKTIIDQFLGYSKCGETPAPSEQRKSWIVKHLRRHHWLTEHKSAIRELIKGIGDFEVRSIFITSSVLPISYLRKQNLVLPVVAYNDIESHGIKALEDAWEYHVLNNETR